VTNDKPDADFGKGTVRGDEAKERDAKAIGAILEWAKVITALGTGSLVLSAALLSNVLKGTARLPGLLIGSWVLFGVSVFFGVMLLGNVCFLFTRACTAGPSIYNKTTRTLAIVHLAAFLLGVAVFLAFASFNL
jgi:hypothetical protein